MSETNQKPTEKSQSFRNGEITGDIIIAILGLICAAADEAAETLAEHGYNVEQNPNILDDWKGNVDELVKKLQSYPIEGLKRVITVKNGIVSWVYL